MSKLEAEFKFEIGEEVYFTVGRNRDVSFKIQFRLIEECEGGIQKLYQLVGDTFKFPEFAFTKDKPISESYWRSIIKKELNDRIEPAARNPSSEPEPQGCSERCEDSPE